MADVESRIPLWHVEVCTQLDEFNRGSASVSFADPSLEVLLLRVQQMHPDSFGFAVYRDDCGYIFPSPLYQMFVLNDVPVVSR